MRKVRLSFRVSISILFVLSFSVFFPTNSFSASQDFSATIDPITIPSSNEAIVILATVTVQEMQFARKTIEQYGGRIESIFPPSVFFATIPRDIVGTLEAQGLFDRISFETVDPNYFKEYEPSTVDAIKVWNTMIQQHALPADDITTKGEQDYPPFYDSILIPSGLPKTSAEKSTMEQDYLEGWEQRKTEWLIEEQQKKEQWEEKRQQLGYPPVPASSETTKDESSSSTTSSFGKATGAGFLDTSLYLAGDVSVGIFYVDGSAGAWTKPEAESVFASVTSALNQFVADEPNAKLTFTYKQEVFESENFWDPYPPPLDERTYVNNLRNTFQTHWSYMIIIAKGDGRAGAYLFGPTFYLYSEDLRDGYVARHETMHIFGAMDQYHPDAAQSPIARWGYLNVVNANSQFNDGFGYFSGAGEGLDDIMINGWGVINPIGVYTRGQIGWRDSDGDAVIDPLDTVPHSVIVSKTGTNQLTYVGNAVEKPIFNEYNNPLGYPDLVWWLFGDVGLNAISSVEYRVNQQAWVAASPQDGAFDTSAESFTFTTPQLKNGQYTIEIRATNSANNTQVSYTKDTVSIQGSSVTNIAPFAAFSVNRSSTSLEGAFALDASLSSDIENSTSQLQVRWDFQNDGVWDTSFSTTKTATATYTTAGFKTIRLEVRDTGNLTHSVTKQVEVTAVNRAPVASFKATPENQQNNAATFPVTFDATASWDGEDAPSSLLARWDFEGDGVWDTSYTNSLTASHNYSLTAQKSEHWSPKLELLDTDSHSAQSTPHKLWSVTYNHTAAGSSLEGVYKEGELKNTFVGNFNTSGSAVDVYVTGNYAYVADGEAGLKIINIANPSSPAQVGSYDTPGQAGGVFVSGNYAYVADGTSGLQVINISNPASPTLTGTLNTPNNALDLFVSGNYVYLADWATGLLIINVSNPSSPSLVRTVDFIDQAYDVTVFGNYAYVACWAPTSSESGSLQIVDVSNPASAVTVGSHDTGDATGVVVQGHYAYVTDWESGLNIFDIANPASPVLAGYYTAVGSIYGVQIVDNYAYFITNAITTALQIVDISNPAIPVLAGRFEHPAMVSNGIWVAGPYVYTAGGEAGLNIFSSTNYPMLTLVGNLNTNGLNSNVEVVGKYAYLANLGDGIQIADISDPVRPTVIGNHPAYYANDICVAGNYAYVADGAVGGLRTVDVTNPGSPATLELDDTSGEALGVYCLDGYIYLADGSAGLVVYSISNPANPQQVGTVDTPGDARTVYAVKGSGTKRFVYVADGGSGLQIYEHDTTKGAPSFLGNYPSSGFVYDVVIFYQKAYVAIGYYDLEIINVSDPASPVLIGSYLDPESTRETVGVDISWPYIYLAQGKKGIQAVDITDPTSPILAGELAIIPDQIYDQAVANNVAVIGPYVYVADGDQGMEVIYTGHRIEASMSASDPDSATTWDGLLEYRWDLNNDQIWDTSFSESNTLNIPISLGTSITGQVKDRFQASATMSGVSPIKYPPRLYPIGNKSVTVENAISFQVIGGDSNGNSLTLSASGLPTGAGFVNNGNNTATFSWTPNASQGGVHNIIFQASDGELTDSETVAVTVSVVNTAPSLNYIGDKSVHVGMQLSFTVSATDAQGNPLTYSADGLPSGATFNSSTGQFTWTPMTSQLGIYNVTFNVSDGQFTDSETITVDVFKIYMPDPNRGCGFSCFVKGTPVIMADGSRKAIEKVQVGESVLAFDEETKGFKADKVTEFFKHKADKYYVINKRLKVTEEHPVYANGQWIEAGKLKTGDHLLGANGKPEKVTSIKVVKRKVNVFNLEVNPYHTYIAGGVVVHNKGSRCRY